MKRRFLWSYRTDGREHLLHVEVYWGLQVEAPRLRNISSHRGAYTNWVRVCEHQRRRQRLTSYGRNAKVSLTIWIHVQWRESLTEGVASFLRRLSNIYTCFLTTRTPLISVIGCLIRRRTPCLYSSGQRQRRKHSIFGDYLFAVIDLCMYCLNLFVLTFSYSWLLHSISGLLFRRYFHDTIYSAVFYHNLICRCGTR